jgi:hypothetical protein
MKHERESLIQVTSTIPMSRGWTTPSSSHWWRRWCRWSQKGQPRVAPAASPLLSSQSVDLYCVFRVSPPSPREIARRGVYIVGFRSRQVRGIQDCVKMMLKGEMGPTMRLACGPTWYLLTPALWAHGLLFFQKNGVAIFFGTFDVQKFPKSQKHAKTRKYASQC